VEGLIDFVNGKAHFVEGWLFSLRWKSSLRGGLAIFTEVEKLTKVERLELCSEGLIDFVNGEAHLRWRVGY